MKRAFVKTLCQFAVIFVIMFVMMFAAILAFAEPAPVEYERYVVQSGDTLWEIAHSSDGYNSVNIQVIIDDLCKKSELEGNYIYPGQVVYIPMYYVD